MSLLFSWFYPQADEVFDHKILMQINEGSFEDLSFLFNAILELLVFWFWYIGWILFVWSEFDKWLEKGLEIKKLIPSEVIFLYENSFIQSA